MIGQLYNLATHCNFHARGTVVPNITTSTAPAVEIMMAAFTGEDRARCVFWF
jgi:hypothetical protein